MILLMKKVNTQIYLDRIISLLTETEGAVIPVAGNSMEPFLKDGRDQVYLVRPRQNEVYQPGEIVLFQRDNGQYVLHRIVMAGEKLLIIRGDNQMDAEPVKTEQVKARVIRVRRNNRWMTPESMVWKFYAGPWNRSLWLRKTASRFNRLLRR